MQEVAKTAITVQDASNLSGVVRSFAGVTKTLWDEARNNGKGTDWVNKHPVAVLFATQIGHLTGTCGLVDTDIYSKAYEECERLANQ
jgi:hypothetical protein